MCLQRDGLWAGCCHSGRDLAVLTDKVSVQCIVTVKTVNRRAGICRKGIENKTESPIVPLVWCVGAISPFLSTSEGIFNRGQYRERQKDKKTYSLFLCEEWLTRLGLFNLEKGQ